MSAIPRGHKKRAHQMTLAQPCAQLISLLLGELY